MSDVEKVPDPITQLQVGATQLHEWYLSLREAGFTEREAISLMGEILRPEPKS